MAIYDTETLRHRVTGKVSFEFYQGDKLWYKCQDGWQFAVPCKDLGSATVGASEKGATLMRWIRKGMEDEARLCEEARAEAKAGA